MKKEKSIKSLYVEAKKYANDILDLVEEALKKKKIKYERKEYEIIIKNKSKNVIQKEMDKIEVPEEIKEILLKVLEINKVIYIRQKSI